MKILLGILLLLSSLPVFSQKRPDDFTGIDQKVKSIRVTATDTLARQLAALGKTDREKVRAIFRWITEHIDYNMKIFTRNRKAGGAGFIYEEPEDTAGPLPSLNERVAAKVLRRKIAFCDGYSRLFKTLCDHAGIRSEVIIGYGRTNRTATRFSVNHTWNAVYLDNAWHLLDVTWASGFASYSNEYVRQYDDFYFLTPPEQFIRDHYPEDPQWTLLPDPSGFREFKQSPFWYSAFIKSGIISYLPATGIIEAAVGDTIRVELKTKTVVKSFFVAETPVTDSSQIFLQPAYTVNGERISFTHTVTSNARDWLYVFYNDEIVMRYKLNVKEEKETGTNKMAGFIN